ncbi:NAD(P)/FAD-dependent oxidoreductase [Virgibacillus halophilus]|uniref:NAD(P)/FAD-dependent oxidoreductase n=1 Tax=Tigheibacillus halophilus TaxID=361280 RepID=UPI003635E601
MKKIIIIGAGILGATTAYRLAKAGEDVTIIDQQIPGRATQVASGIICPWLSKRRNQAWYKLAKHGAKLYPELVKELTEDGQKNTGYKRTGALFLRNSKEKLQAFKQSALVRREEAPEIGEITLLNPQQATAIFPPLQEAYGAVHIAGGARVDGGRLVHSLLEATKMYGARIIKGQAMLQQKEDTVWGVEVNEKTIEADAVIAVNGAWMRPLLAEIGIDFLGSFQKGQLVHLRTSQSDTSDWPVVLPPSGQSIVSFDDHLVIGASHENDASFDARITVGAMQDVLTKALTFAPGLAQAEITTTKYGFRPFTPDFLPIFGPIPELKGLFIANGLGASGMTTGPFIATTLADIVRGKRPAINVDDYTTAGAIRTK